MPVDVKITVEKLTKGCTTHRCWAVFRSDRKDPIIGGLTEQQANGHKKIMSTLYETAKPKSVTQEAIAF